MIVMNILIDNSMRNKKLEKLEEDIYNAIDDARLLCWDEDQWYIDEKDLKEKIRFLLWEYEMQGFLDD